MKRLFAGVIAVLFLSWLCFAQTNTDDTPATQDDVQRYFQVAKSHDMMKKMIGAMTQNIQKMTHEQYLQHKDELPPGYETKMNAMMDDMLTNMPLDQMMQAMVPAYQKHLTRGDIDNLVAFYSTATGAKLLREMPAMMAEAMQDMMPIISKYMETVQQKMMKETDNMIAQSKKQPHASTPAANN
jgi:hypothetical protein